MSMDNKKRLLTVGYKMSGPLPYRDPVDNKVKYGYMDYPYMRLAGKWLMKAGFSAGDIIEIDVQENCLVIRKTPNKWVTVGEVHNVMVNESGEHIKKVKA